jgi:hypothetical protein
VSIGDRPLNLAGPHSREEKLTDVKATLGGYEGPHPSSLVSSGCQAHQPNGIFSSAVASRQLDQGYADFYEKAIFVKPTWRPVRG